MPGTLQALQDCLPLLSSTQRMNGKKHTKDYLLVVEFQTSLTTSSILLVFF
jgi:hypothetical protein